MMWHQLIHAIGGSLGIALLLGSYLYWGNFRLTSNNPFRSILLVCASSMSGLFFCLWTFHSSVSTHKTAIGDLFQNGQGSNNTTAALTLGLLGLVMTLVTMGVISISRSAIEDMRKERAAMRSHYKAIESGSSKLDLTQYRIQLIYENDRELRAFSDDSDDSDDINVKNFREQLQVYYAQREMLVGYLNYLVRYYNRETIGQLMDLEKDYLLAIRRHYLTFPKSDDNGKIIGLVDAVIKKL